MEHLNQKSVSVIKYLLIQSKKKKIPMSNFERLKPLKFLLSPYITFQLSKVQ